MNYCKCGCGQPIPETYPNGRKRYAQDYLRNHHWRGRKRINENRNQYGEKNNNWKGGRIIDGSGYIQVRCEEHPRATKRGSYVKEQVVIMEKHLGRFLTSDETVHHINGNRQDNRIENLKLLTPGEHSRVHRLKEYAEGKKFGRHRNKNAISRTSSNNFSNNR